MNQSALLAAGFGRHFGAEYGFDRPVYGINPMTVGDAMLMRVFAQSPHDVIINPEITSALILGQMERGTSFVEYFAPPNTVTKKEIKYPTWPNKEWMERKNTLRAPSAKYGTSRPVPSDRSTTLLRHSWATYADVEVLSQAEAVYRLGEKFASFSQRIVRKSLEYEVSDILLNVTPGSTYHANHITTLTSGNEFNATTPALTPRKIASPLLIKICEATGCEMRDLRCYGSLSTRDALFANADFQTWQRGDTPRQADPDDATIARYFGIGGALFENAMGVTTSFGPMFTDVLIFFLPGAGGEYDQTFGERRFIAHWRMNAGVASDPWLERATSSWWYPWDEEWKIEHLDNQAAAIIVNCAV